MDNLFPNSQWQLWTALGPGWDGGATPIYDHLANFETEWNWLLTGNLPGINISYCSSSTIQGGSYQKTITITGDSNVQYLYPGAIVVFYGAVDSSLQQSPMRVRSVNYTNKNFPLLAVRNSVPPTGQLTGAGCRQIMRCDRGMNGGAGQGHGPDGWTKYPSSSYVWPDRWPRVPSASTPEMTFAANAVAPDRPAWTCNQRPSTKRALVFQPRSSADAFFYHSVPDWRSLCGRSLVFGMWVRRVGSTGVGRLYVNDGSVTKSTTSVTSGSWTWIEMACSIANEPPSGVSFGFVAENSSGICWEIVEPRLDFGTNLGSGNYLRPKARIEKFVVKITPDSYFWADYVMNSNGTTDRGYGNSVDIFGETGGAIAEDVPIVFSQLEFTSDIAGRALSIRNDYDLPHRFGPAARSPVAGGTDCDSAPIDVGANGDFWIYSNAPNASITDLSIDLNQAILW